MTDLIQLIGSTCDPTEDLNLIQVGPNQSLTRLLKNFDVWPRHYMFYQKQTR